ncbi:hypothetical protein D3C73_1633870 [compost metagenome]
MLHACADFRLKGRDPVIVPVIGRQRQIGGVEHGDPEALFLQLRAIFDIDRLLTAAAGRLFGAAGWLVAIADTV